MKKLRLTRRSARDWTYWRSRSLERHAGEKCHAVEKWHAVEEWRIAERCRRCAELAAEVAALVAELAARGTGERVVVVWRDGESTPGGRVQALVDGLLSSLRNHRVVWGFIGAVVAGVLGTIFYYTVILWMLG